MTPAASIDPDILDEYIVDLNSNKIPPDVLDIFWPIKNELGSHPLAIAFFPVDGWYIVDSMGTIYAHLNK